jgi:predicted nucleotide-binding protein (sugar kinase/HSP70/actin superfamily)
MLIRHRAAHHGANRAHPSGNGKRPPSTGGTRSSAQVRIERKRRELEREHGLSRDSFEHFQRPIEQPFTASQRQHTTILLGGLSPCHDKLVEAAVQSLGYHCKALPNVTMDSYTVGRHFTDHGLCNPTYFTVGNLVTYLQDLESKGMSRQEIIDSHVFVTAGSCGTCRFGMYEAAYRLALGNAGFRGFRVLTFGTNDGLDQSTGEAVGLDMNLDFFLGLFTAFGLADVLNQFKYRIRAYEVVPGSVDEVVDRVVSDLHRMLKDRECYELADHWTRIFLRTPLETPIRYAAKILHVARSDEITDGMKAARSALDQIELDPFRVRPIVKITGEFWAQTTQGPGNFDIHRFLEREGAEVYVDRILFTRLMWELHQGKSKARDRLGLRDGDSRIRHYGDYYRKVGLLTLAERMLRRENERLLAALGGSLHSMVPQAEMERIARPYWNWRTTSGESHLEIAENIYDHTHDLCHMVLSVKPFGCMPSTQSDGVQTWVVEDYPGMIFLPIETSGDGEVMAHSRVQMALGPARAKARREMDDVLSDIRWTLNDLKAYADDHPHIKRASYSVPHHPGIVGRAANFAYHVSELLDARPASSSMAAGRA